MPIYCLSRERVNAHDSILLAASGILLLAIAGCQQQYSSATPAIDEAMQRAVDEHKNPEAAAREYFFPKQPIPDYFEGMDAVSQPHPLDPAYDPQKNWPDQLLDQHKSGSSYERAPTKVEPLKLTESEILGRNTWMIWCAGNEGFWDWLANNSLGLTDFLKVLDSRNRSTRFREAGLINQPGMTQASAATDETQGLWFDVPVDEAARKFRAEYLKKAFDPNRPGGRPPLPGYGGDSAGGDSQGSSYSRGLGMMSEGNSAYATGGMSQEYDSKIPPPEIYGLSSGVIGLRLFPNPKFNAEARKKWDAKRYYEDEKYYSDPNLVRPFRVGMSCAFCHASFHPLKPPRDVTNPEWANISGNIGAQYLRIRAIFGNLLKRDNFVWHLLDSEPPGTVDTSLIASDNINNPNTMNSVFNLPQRVLVSFRNPKEALSPASKSLTSLWENADGKANHNVEDRIPDDYRKIFEAQGLLAEAQDSNSNPRRTPRVLLDGADSIGAYGALARVYLNIGSYWERWNQLHQPLIGFRPQQPFTITDCEHNSVFWHATKLRVGPLRDYFLKITPPMPLLSTDGAIARTMPINHKALEERARYDKLDACVLMARERTRHIDVEKLARGRQIFARNCIVCHSSVQPPERHLSMEQSAHGAEFWDHDPGRWLSDPKYMTWAENAVEDPAFWRFNYLSTDYRIPINLVRTNASRAMATNALTGHMWEDFSSESYRTLPSVGPIKFFDPFSKKSDGIEEFVPRHRAPQGAPPHGGGPGFYRVPTLISIWATAPFLHNNSLGLFNNDPSVNGRLDAFDDAIRKLLWPERRLQSSSYNDAAPERLKKDHGLIWRTCEETYLNLPGQHVPYLFEQTPFGRWFRDAYPWLKSLRPLWLLSLLLLLGSFLLLLVANTVQKTRTLSYWTCAAAAGAALLLWVLHDKVGWFPQLSQFTPQWLPVWALSLAAVIFWLLGSLKTTRLFGIWSLILGLSTLTVEVLHAYPHGFAWLGWLGPAWIWGAILLLIALVMLGTSRRDDPYLLALALLWLSAIPVAFYLHQTYVAVPMAMSKIGPLWPLAALLLVLSGVLLFVPDYRRMTRYLGYLSLLIALGIGFGTYFVGGQLGDLRLGPIPKGTPVNLLSNINPEADPKELKAAIKTTLHTFAEIQSKSLEGPAAQQLLHEKAGPALMKVNKCPDFVMDQGHYFEWFKTMTDDDKEALIELLKTF